MQNAWHICPAGEVITDVCACVTVALAKFQKTLNVQYVGSNLHFTLQCLLQCRSTNRTQMGIKLHTEARYCKTVLHNWTPENCQFHSVYSLYATILNITLHCSGPRESQIIILSDKDKILNTQPLNAILFTHIFFLYFFVCNRLFSVDLNSTIMTFLSFRYDLIFEFSDLVFSR